MIMCFLAKRLWNSDFTSRPVCSSAQTARCNAVQAPCL